MELLKSRGSKGCFAKPRPPQDKWRSHTGNSVAWRLTRVMARERGGEEVVRRRKDRDDKSVYPRE
eukprot:752163-Hanusia_phi.AAC.3